jgi:hypothetical protein
MCWTVETAGRQAMSLLLWWELCSVVAEFMSRCSSEQYLSKGLRMMDDE